MGRFTITMKQTMTGYIKWGLSSLNPFRPPGPALPVVSSRRLSWSMRISLAAIFYCLSIGCAFLLFDNYATIFTSQKLLTTSPTILLKALAEPVAYFALCVYFLTIGITLARTIFPLLFIPVLFMVDNDLSLISFLSSLLVLIAFLIYYFQFLKSFSDLKKPTLAKAFNSSLALFIAVVSLAVTLNYYNGFSARIARVSDKLGLTVNQRFGFILNDSNSETTKGLKRETLRSHAQNYLTVHKIAVNEPAITQRERQIVSGLDLPSAKANDDYRALLDRSIKRQVTTTINNYHKLFSIVVPFAFFFVTDVLANVSSNIVWGLLLLTEWGLRR